MWNLIYPLSLSLPQYTTDMFAQRKSEQTKAAFYVCISESVFPFVRISSTSNPHVTALLRVQDKHVLSTRSKITLLSEIAIITSCVMSSKDRKNGITLWKRNKIILYCSDQIEFQTDRTYRQWLKWRNRAGELWLGVWPPFVVVDTGPFTANRCGHSIYGAHNVNPQCKHVQLIDLLLTYQ